MLPPNWPYCAGLPRYVVPCCAAPRRTGPTYTLSRAPRTRASAVMVGGTW